jgi:hypothetical protein
MEELPAMSILWRSALMFAAAMMCAGATVASSRRDEAASRAVDAGNDAVGLECREDGRTVAAARACRP